MKIKTIAEMAGVSVSTVSKILNNYSDVGEETRKKVLGIMEQQGYSPTFSSTHTSNKGRSNLIGVIFAGEFNIEMNHQFFLHVLNMFKKRIGLYGFDLLFFSNEKQFHHAEKDYLSRCRYFNVDGCVIFAGDDIEHAIHELDQSDIPCIGIDLNLKGRNSGHIMTDNTKVSLKVVEHFYLNGYRDIGFIGSSFKSEISRIREESFKQALTSFGLPINQEWIINGTDFFENTGYQLMKMMLEQDKLPSAIFAASDLLAIGAMRALYEHNLSVPGDMAIIGCDDIDACKYTNPPLTTIRQDHEKIGLFAAHMLFDLINNQIESSSVLVEPEIIIRDSCQRR
ncbi:LacI family DNA-binding transcriptional regulator [Paenibacillus sp. SI8]|uniref:LacI family DNA-binding transcriptional regulator n=1 Tax=unclassified Paenibacillus TaxID=185978 RepID=UPI003465F6B7